MRRAPLIFCLGKRTALAAAILAAIACVVVGISAYPDTQRFYLNRWTFPAALPILAGCILAFICTLPSLVKLMDDRSSSGILLIAICFGVATPAFINSDVVWLASVCALVLYIFHNQDSLLVKILEFKPLSVLGVISYGLYVWQGIFTGNGPYRSGGAFPPPVDVGVWLTFIVAPISYVFFEKPIMRFKHRYSWRATDQSGASAHNLAGQ